MTALNNLSRFCLIGIEAALQAGDLLKKGFGSQFSISTKPGIHNLVTEYDHLSEDTIIDYIRKNVPSSDFLAEESGRKNEKNASVLWIVDPLDGTVNFAHQIPVFSVSIAASIQNEVVCGIVYQPMTQELFVAEKGRGAFLNGRPIHVSSTSSLKESILATGFPYNLIENPSNCIEHFIDILRLGIPLRRLGSAAIDLAYTAAGRFDGFFETKLSPWDCAAGNLLVNEAGGIVTQWDGRAYQLEAEKPILATNHLIHQELSTKLSKK